MGCSSGSRVAKSAITSLPFSQIHWITKAVSWQLQVSQVYSANRWQHRELFCQEKSTWMSNTCHFQDHGLCVSIPAQDTVIPGWLKHCYNKVHTKNRRSKAARPQVLLAAHGLSHKFHTIKATIWYLKSDKNIFWHHLWLSRRHLWNCMDTSLHNCLVREDNEKVTPEQVRDSGKSCLCSSNLWIIYE